MQGGVGGSSGTELVMMVGIIQGLVVAKPLVNITEGGRRVFVSLNNKNFQH